MSARDVFFVQSRWEGLCTESREWYVPFPSLHHRKGWLRHQRNFAKPPAKRQRDSAQPQVKLTQPGWFSIGFIRKTTPASRSADASRYFPERSATPPCG